MDLRATRLSQLQDVEYENNIYIPLEKLDEYLKTPSNDVNKFKINNDVGKYTQQMREMEHKKYIQHMEDMREERNIYNSYHFNKDVYDNDEMQYKADSLIYTDDYQGEFYSDDEDDADDEY